MCPMFQEIPRGELHPCLEAKKPENKVKNRYISILPCKSYLYTKNDTFEFSFQILFKTGKMIWFFMLKKRYFIYFYITIYFVADDHSLVVLRITNEDGGYINANYIKVRIAWKANTWCIFVEL